MMISSSPSRRSPRLAKHGLHLTPPARNTARKGASSQDVNCVASFDQMTTPTEGKKTNRIKTSDSCRVRMPSLSATTLNYPGNVRSQSEVSRGEMATKTVTAGDHIIAIARRTRRAAISPRTRGSAIISILASPGEFAGNNTTRKRFVSPSNRSSAEATLHHLARASAGNERYLDSGNGAGEENLPAPLRRTRGRRKAATAANGKFRSLCEKDDFDDPEDLIEIGKKALGDLVVGESIQSSSSSSNSNEPLVTVEAFNPKGKVDRRWFRNFKKWISSQQEPTKGHSLEPTDSALALSPLPKRWTQHQRAHYRLFQNNEKSQMTVDRISLLESAGFSWKLQKKNNTTRANSKHVQSNDCADKTTSESDTLKDKGGQKSETQVESKPASKSCSEDPSESTDKSLSIRKSQRRSCPTEFYHNLGTETFSPGTEKYSATGISVLRQPNETKLSDARQSRTVPDPKLSAEASTTTTKNGKKPSPSKRRSMSTANESLASLPADTTAKEKPDKQSQGKRKKRRGQHSMSLLSALEVHMETSGRDGKSDDIKGLVSFSHRELQQELSKSKKKLSRKKPESVTATKKMVKKPKPKTLNEQVGGKASETASIIAKKSTSSTGHESSDGRAATKDMKDKKDAIATVQKSDLPSSLESPLRATKLLLPLSDGDEPRSNCLGSESTGKSDADMSEVCVTKLLLSCLSEDSAEKDAPHGGSIPVSTKGIQSSFSCQESRKIPDSHDTPARHAYFSSNPKHPRESLTLDPSIDGLVANNIRAGCSSSNSNEQGTDLIPTPSGVKVNEGVRSKFHESSEKTSRSSPNETPAFHSAGDIKSNQTTKPLEEVGPRQGKVSMALSLQGTFAQEKKVDHAGTSTDGEKRVHHLREPAGRSSLSTHWTCDVCQEATVVESDDALVHERGCVEINNNGLKPSLPNMGEKPAASKKRENNPPMEDQEKPKSKWTSSSATKGDLAEKPFPQKESISNTLDPRPMSNGENTFEEYFMAYERGCVATNNNQSKHSLSIDGKEEDNESNRSQNNHLVEEPLKPTGRSDKSQSSPVTRGISAEHPTLPHEEINNERIKSWTCDICQEATFESYKDAVAHERICSSKSHNQGEPSSTERERNPLIGVPMESAGKSVSRNSGCSPVTRGRSAEQHTLSHEEINNERVKSWTCDLCQEATFESYEDAVAHERICAGKSHNQGEPSSKERESNPLVEEPLKPTVKSKSDKSESSTVTEGRYAQQPKLSREEINNERINRWTCDTCQEATFENYDDAVAHERKCTDTKNFQAKHSSLHNEETEVAASEKRMVYLPTEEQIKPIDKSKHQMSKTLLYAKASFAERSVSPPKNSTNERIKNWTCERFQEASFEDFGDAIAHEKECTRRNNTQANLSVSNKEEEKGKASKKRKVVPFIEETEKSTSKSKRHNSVCLSSMAGNFAHRAEREGGSGSFLGSISIGEELSIHPARGVDVNTQTEPSISTSRTQSASSVPIPAADAASLARKSKYHKSKSSSSMKGKLRQQQNENVADSVPGSFSIRNEEPPIHSVLCVDDNSQKKPSSSTSSKQCAYSITGSMADVGNSQAPSLVEKQDDSQPTPIQNRDPVDEFSPLSLTSPLLEDNMLESNYDGKNNGIQHNVPFPPSQSNDVFIQPVKPTLTSRTKLTKELATPTCLSLASHSLPSGSSACDPQLQMIVAEKHYQDKMAEFGRLELEAKIVTERMLEIEGKINGLGSNRPLTRSNGISNSAERHDPSPQKSSFQSESKSLSLQRSHSWSNHYESSEEGEHSNEHYSQSRRRQERHTSSDETARKSSWSAEEDAYERSAKRVRVRSRFSHEEKGRKIRSSYDDSEIHVESSSSRRSKKVDRHRTESFSAPSESHSNHAHPPSHKKRGKGGDSRKAAFRPKKRSRSKRKKKSQHSRFSDAEEESRKPAAHRRAAEGRLEKKRWRPCSEKPPGKLCNQQREEGNDDSKSSAEEPRLLIGKSNIIPMSEMADADDRDSDVASTKLTVIVQGGKDESNERESAAVRNAKDDSGKDGSTNGGASAQQQANPTRDPLYWLAGGGNSSDDESWDFDGPMILPPPPI